MIQLLLRTPVIPKKNKKNPGITESGRLYTFRSKTAIDSQETLQKEAWALCVKKGIKPRGVRECRMRVIFKRTTADLIGVMETLQDALEGVIYDNDKQICETSMRWDTKTDPFLPQEASCYVEITFVDEKNV